ncbi:HEAT repeat domain-containing protein [Microtetraspora fusca]|uniref:HEAT repeat domain-containing protein n=1 Tax=Microtetraspora fusca TaxID=1997 RepID=UPI000832743D|nr:HEAT repeat domain-containing protein [Microtetraspora fusca]
MTGVKGFRRRRIRPLARAKRFVDVVPELVAAVDAGRPHAVQDLCVVLVNVVTHDGLAERALDALASGRPTLWLDLDPMMRHPWYGYSGPVPRGRVSVVREPANPLAVALRACSPDGHRREQAVRDAVMRTDPRLLPVLLIRAADWVEEVRAAALETLALVLTEVATSDLLSLVPVAVRLGDRRRGGCALASVRSALVRADDETLATMRDCADLRARRFAYEISLDRDRLPESDLVAAALGEADVVSRIRCAEAISRMDRPDLLARLLAARSARVRAVALTGLVRLGRPEHGSRFLGDPSTVTRLTAQWAVRRAGGDPAHIYRRLLAGRPGPEVRNLIAGLADCGGGADADLVRPYLADPRPRVRAEAVRTLHRLGAPMDLVALLGDPSPVVVRRAAAALRDSGVPADRLWPLLDTTRPRHVRQAAHRLLSGADDWTRLKADLTLVGDADASLRRRARDDLAAWRENKAPTLYTKPPEPLRDELTALIDIAETSLGPGGAAGLRWFLSQ